MSTLIEDSQPIRTREDFIEFMRLLLLNLQRDGNEWENRTLKDYLEAMQGWVEDMDGYYLNRGEQMPIGVQWGVFADILQAATIYE